MYFSVQTEEELEAANIMANFAALNENRISQKRYEDAAIQVDTYNEFNTFNISNLITSDYTLRILTGIHSLALLNVIVQMFTHLAPTKCKMSTKNMVLLTLMRIKLDIPFTMFFLV